MATKATELLKQEVAKKEKEIMAKAAKRVKETVFFETEVEGPKAKLRFTGEGPSPAFNREFRGSDGPLPNGNIQVPRTGMLIVSQEYADSLQEDYPDEFDEIEKVAKEPGKKKKAA